MKFLLLTLFTLASCTKERFEDAASLTDELLHELEKRIYNLNQEVSSEEGVPSQISDFRRTNDKIIKTSESIEAGAVYLGSPELTTETLCKTKCLTNLTCNLAVFKEKDGETSCYLFNCKKPSVCSFVEHRGFSILELPDRDTTRKGVSSEDDLEHLAASKPTSTVTSTTSTPSTTSPTTTVITTTVQTQPPRHQPVPLFSECKSHKDCAGSSSQCLAGYCVCQDGYHPQEGLCRPDCTKFQFECSNDGQPLAYPQCIAIYDKCDQIKHCRDGSDEKNCIPDTTPAPAAVQSPKNPGTDDKDFHKFGHESSGTMQHKPVHPTEPDKKPDIIHPATEKPYIDKTMKSNSPGHEDEMEAVDEGNAGYSELTDPKSKEDQIGKEQSSKPPTDEELSSSNEQVNPKLDEEEEEVKVPDSVKPIGDNQDSQHETIEVIEVENGSLVGVAVDESPGMAKTGVSVVVQSNTGAVVALSLGLAITFLLLFFVGCRLRNIRKRLRRGRPMNTNEADYLINGMYL